MAESGKRKDYIFEFSFIIKLTMVSSLKGILFLGMLGMLVTGCGRNLDLAKIVAKNIAFEIQHPVQSPAAKLLVFEVSGLHN